MPESGPSSRKATEAELFRLLAENVKDCAVFVIDADRRVRTWTDGAARLLGYAEEEILGEPADRFFLPEEVEAGAPEAEVRQALETGRGCDDRWHVRKDGTRFWASGTLTPLRDEHGTLYGFGKVMRDQTELMLAQEAARETDERFRSLMEQAPFSIQIFSADGRTVRVNRAWEELWGISADRIGDYNVLQDPQLEAKGVASHLRRAFSGEPAFLLEVEYDPNESVPGRTQYDEPVRWVSAVAYPLKDALGNVREVALVHEDITARRQAEAALRGSEAWLRLALDAGTMGTWDWDIRTGRIRWSENLEAIHGLATGSFDGTFDTYRTLIHPEDLPGLQAAIEQSLRYGTTYDAEFRFVRGDGSVGWMAGRGKAYFDEGGQPLRMVGVGIDVTGRRRAEEALRQSESRLRTLSDNLPSGAIYQAVRDSGEDTARFTYLSAGVEAIFGVKAEAALRDPGLLYRSIHEADLPRVLAVEATAFDNLTVFDCEFRHRHPDGEIRWVHARSAPRRLADGGVLWEGVILDITSAKRAEEELLRQTKLLKTITDNADSALVMVDIGGRLTFVNPAFTRITGYARAEAEGRLVHETVHYKYPDGRPFPIEECPLDGAYRKHRGPLRGHEDVFTRKDGSLFPIVASVAPLEEDGRTIGAVAEFRDVTREKEAEAALRRNDDVSRFLADASAALAGLTDYASTLQKVARLAVPHFADWCAVDMLDGDSLCRVAVAHIDPAKVEIAHEFNRRFPPDPTAPHGVWRIVRTGQSEHIPEITDSLLEETVKDPERLDLVRMLGLRSYIGVPLKVRDEVLGVVTFVAAESGRRFDARDLDVAEDLANRAAVAVENVRLYEEVRDADRRKDEFLAMLAHELRNPLAPIRSGLDILRMSGAEGDVVDLMGGQVEHLVRLVDDLLDVSRILRGRVELRRSSVELSEVVRRAVETVRPMFEAARQQFVLALPKEPARLEADPVRLAQVLTNLLNNASKYTEPGGRITLAAERDGVDIVLRVADTGIGIEPQLLPHVFDLFTQSTRSIDRSQGGLGIGLTIVRSLVEMHGGTVAARSEGPGTGSEFVVRLAILEPEAAAAVPPAEYAPPNAGRRILVVDDNVPAAKLLMRLLTKLGGHEVVTAHDGTGALAAAEAYRPDLILLDIGLPRMDGYEVARRLRAKPEFAETLLVALTGYGTDEDRRRSAAAGFDDHLVKPPGVDLLRGVLAHPKLKRT